MTKMRLSTLAALALWPVAIAQAQAPARGDIVLQGLIQPEIETLSLTASCSSRTFSFTIANHRLRPSELTDARRDRRPPRDPESTAGLQRFLSEAREVRFQGATCVSESEIGIGLAGLLFSPAPGQRDDVMRGFRIRF